MGVVSRSTPDPRIGVVPSRCPACEEFLNAATDADDSDLRPKADDRSICIHCGALLKYLPNLQLALLNGEETTEMLHDLNDQERKAIAHLLAKRLLNGRRGRA